MPGKERPSGGGGGTTSPLTTKGDIYGYSTTNARLPVGANGTVITADSGEALGVKWGTAGAGDVTAAAVMTDNTLIRGDGGAKGIQDSGITIDDSDNITNVTSITVGNTGLTVGASVPFSDSTGTLTLQNVDALDATSEATIEAAIDALANLTSIGSSTGIIKVTAGTLSYLTDNTTNWDSAYSHVSADGSSHSFIDQSVVSGATPTFTGTNFTGIPDASIDLAVVGTPTYDNAEDWFNNIQSAGIISGGVISDGGSGTIDTTDVKGIVKSTNSALGANMFFDLAGLSGQALTDNSINYIAVDYNAGTPQYVVGVTSTANGHTIFNLGKVYREGTTIDIITSGLHIEDFSKRLQQREVAASGIIFTSGAAIGETGTRNISLSAGVMYAGLNRIATTAIDTSVADTFEYYYNDGAWQESDQTQIDNTQYNNVGTGLATLSNNQYGVHWVYKGTGTKTYVIYGQDSYTLSGAQDAQPPSSLPDHVSEMGVLRGKIIIEKSDTTFTEIESVLDTNFQSSTPSNHNELSNIDGGTAGEYYHLTSAQHTIATTAAATAQDGYLVQADWNTFNSKQAALTFGIADTNSVIIDDAGVADDEYAKFTASGIEGRAYADVKTDLSLNNVENTALSTWAGTSNITTLGTVTSGTLSTGAVLADVTMTLGSDADGDVYYRSSNKLTRLAKGTAAQVLTMNAGATAPEWAAAAGGGMFELSSGVVREDYSGSGANTDDFVFGSTSTEDTGSAAEDARFLFDKSKAAFRCGTTNSTQWDDANRGDYSFGCGFRPTASGSYSFAAGSICAATGSYSFAFGANNTASGSNSIVVGNTCVADQDNAFCGGVQSNSTWYGSNARAINALTHTAQREEVCLTANTTDATQETMYIRNNSSYKLTLTASYTYAFTGLVVARQTGGAAGTVADSAAWEIKGVIKRDASDNTSLVGTPSVTDIGADAATSWAVAIAADDTDEELAINITGEADKNIDWFCNVTFAEV